VGRSQARLGFIKPDQPSEAKDMIFPPCVIDADALKLLTEIENWHQMLPSPSILTPHPGEMAVLINRQKDQIQEDRVGVAEEWAKVWGHVVVLKGAFTVVASPDGRTSLIPFATAALARAGTGDVLAGAIVGLRAQGIPPYESAVLGAYLHGRAGELALEMVGSEASVLAGDVAATMVDAIAEMMNFT
jgi:NAD(P)H-hydrate epimerase